MAEKLAVKRPGSSRRQPDAEAAAAAAAAAAPAAEQAPASAGGSAAAAAPSLDATMPRGPPASQAAEPEASTATDAPAAAAAAAAAAAVTTKLDALGLGEDQEEEEEGVNPYENPYRGDDEEGGSFDEEGEAEGDEADEGVSYDGEGGEEGDEDDEEEYYEDEYEDGEEGEDEWEPNVARENHMKGALMIQKAACLEMIGDDAYGQLYELLKSNQASDCAAWRRRVRAAVRAAQVKPGG
jgi:hypothetical protein